MARPKKLEELGDRITKVDPMKVYGADAKPVALSKASPVIKTLKNLEKTAKLRRGIKDPGKAFGAELPTTPTTIQRTPSVGPGRFELEGSENKALPQAGPRPLNTMEITSGPRKGMRVGLGNNNDIKSYDAKGNEVDSDAFLDQSRQMNLAQMRTPTDGVDRSIAGYSIEQDGASDAEMAKFKAGGGGSRILAGGRSARTIQGARPVQADSREAELKSVAMNSKFPVRRRTALRELELMEKSRQFDATSKEGSRQFGIQEGRLGSQQTITNRQAEDRLGIDRSRAAADADYKNYLKTKTDDKSALNANQWHSQNQSYQDAWQKRTAPDSTISQPTDFSDAEGTPLDFKLHQYRDNPRAVEMYGPPNAQQKATLEINADPTEWAEFITLTPQQQQQYIADYIKNQGY